MKIKKSEKLKKEGKKVYVKPGIYAGCHKTSPSKCW